MHYVGRNIWVIYWLEWTIDDYIVIWILFILKLLKVISEQMNIYALFSVLLFWGFNNKLMIKLAMTPLIRFIHICSDKKITTFWSLNKHEY